MVKSGAIQRGILTSVGLFPYVKCLQKLNTAYSSLYVIKMYVTSTGFFYIKKHRLLRKNYSVSQKVPEKSFQIPKFEKKCKTLYLKGNDM